ncbi:ankyrin repeat domain-containing protein [Legionella lytica]|uniref:Ankyrin repeat domain-containing protein n=1 Tax=Legionella lytica TaxID=96232 RepID=A0ABW8D925_9GAMM
MSGNNIQVNDLWAEENPLPHVILANEYFDCFERLLRECSEQLNPNLCDGNKFGNKSLLILLTLLVSNQSLIHEFLDIYKELIDLDYQDDEGKTALHYAIILGRPDLVSRLVTAGASRIILDKNDKCAEDYIFCDISTIKRILKKIDIEPYRDSHALRNSLRDHQERPLMLQGEQMVQNQMVLMRIFRASCTLYLYIKGQDGLSPYIGDNTWVTDEEMRAYARRCSKDLQIPVSDIFIKQKLGIEEHQQFQDKLHTLINSFSGVTVLDRCLEGHKTTRQYLLSDLLSKPSSSLSP